MCIQFVPTGSAPDSNLEPLVRRIGVPSRRWTALALGLLLWGSVGAHTAYAQAASGSASDIGECRLFRSPCDVGTDRCTWSTPTNVRSRTTIAGPAYRISSDGRGQFVSGTANIVGNINGSAAVVLLPPDGGTQGSRTFALDLSSPVPGDIGVPLGVFNGIGLINVHWYTDSAFVQHSFFDIPIDSTVDAELVEIGFFVDGVTYALQVGPQPTGMCYTGRTAIHGMGTSQATIVRTSADEWIVDLPAGSIGRVFDVHLRMPRAINKGLYYVSGRITFSR